MTRVPGNLKQEGAPLGKIAMLGRQRMESELCSRLDDKTAKKSSESRAEHAWKKIGNFFPSVCIAITVWSQRDGKKGGRKQQDFRSVSQVIFKELDARSKRLSSKCMQFDLK